MHLASSESDLLIGICLSHNPFVFVSLFMKWACTVIVWHHAHFTQFPAPKQLWSHSPHAALILPPPRSGGNPKSLSVNPCFCHRKHTHKHTSLDSLAFNRMWPRLSRWVHRLWTRLFSIMCQLVSKTYSGVNYIQCMYILYQPTNISFL